MATHHHCILQHFTAEVVVPFCAVSLHCADLSHNTLGELKAAFLCKLLLAMSANNGKTAGIPKSSLSVEDECTRNACVGEATLSARSNVGRSPTVVSMLHDPTTVVDCRSQADQCPTVKLFQIQEHSGQVYEQLVHRAGT